MTLGWLLCVVSWNLRWQNIINDDRYHCIEIIVRFYQISWEIQGLLLLMTHNLVLLKGRKWGLAATRCWAGRVKHETSPTTGLGWCKLILGEILDKKHNKLRSSAAVDPSVSQSVFTITEKAPTTTVLTNSPPVPYEFCVSVAISCLWVNTCLV